MSRRLLLAFLLPAWSAAQAQSVTTASPKPAASPALPPGFRELADLPYVTHGGPRQRLDLYLPGQSGTAATPRPLLVYFHGGAWRAGSKSASPARRLLPLGYDVASVEYRFSQDAPYPAQIEDAKAAIRWLRAQAAEYGFDPLHIGAWGASAGGHLVALLGVTGQDRQFDTGENLDQSSAVSCVVDFFGPTDFLRYGDVPAAELDAPGSAVAQLLGGPLSAHQALAREASPVYFVTAKSAPFLIFQGDKDPLVPFQQSQELAAALNKAGVDEGLQVIPGGGHGGPGFLTPANVLIILNFLNRYLKPGG